MFGSALQGLPEVLRVAGGVDPAGRYLLGHCFEPHDFPGRGFGERPHPSKIDELLRPVAGVD